MSGSGESTDFTRYLRVVPAEAPRLYGLTPSLMLLDEYQALATDEVYLALSSALHKRPDSKLITISTGSSGATSPLGRLRARALGLPEAKRRGFVTEAHGPDLSMLEWASSRRPRPATGSTPTSISSRSHRRSHRSDDPPICRGFPAEQSAFYTEFDGRRPKRLVIKVLGE